MELEKPPTEGEPGTNCLDCEMYKKLGEVCVVEHGKRFLWEYCKDFRPEVKLPDYNDLMRTVKKDIAIERKKIRQKKKRELALLRRNQGQSKKSKRKSSKTEKPPKQSNEKRNSKSEPKSKVGAKRTVSRSPQLSRRLSTSHSESATPNKARKKKGVKQLTLSGVSKDSDVSVSS